MRCGENGMDSNKLSRCLCEGTIMLPRYSENLWVYKDAGGKQA